MRFITTPYYQWKPVLNFPIPGLTAVLNPSHSWEQDRHRDDRFGAVQGGIFFLHEVTDNWPHAEYSQNRPGNVSDFKLYAFLLGKFIFSSRHTTLKSFKIDQ